ncbi:ABC transporter ATP-binding protein [[Acholeplasma] multilocale]|uniref:ABC transporter ATP-binding protein n=1 Tax=[Acholeplasma] multilocale TaxID=264638 RepID=UPI0005572932|nr:ABC transporter ATP-binding protein [[Acholeplasma] multilocale]
MKKQGNNTLILFSLIYRYIKLNLLISISILILILLSTTITLMVPLITQQLTMAIAIKNGSEFISGFWNLDFWTLIVIGLVLIFVNAFVLYFGNYLGIKLGRKIEIDLRKRMYTALLKQDIQYYSDKKTGELITKFVSDTQIVGEQVSTIPIMLLLAILQILASFTMMFILDWKITLGVLTLFVILTLIILVSFRITETRYSKTRKLITNINGNLTDRISNVRLVKTNATEEKEINLSEDLHHEYYKISEKLSKGVSFLQTALYSGTASLQFLTIIIAMLFYLNVDPKTSNEFFQNTFTSFVMVQAMMSGPLFQMVNITNGIAQASITSVRIMEIIESETSIKNGYEGIEKISSIQMKDIDFSYPEKPEKVVLKNFDFKFIKGKSYAFVGETGSGKSTIAKLLLRHYDVTKGAVLFNGVNIKKINREAFLSKIGYVEQEPQLIYGNVIDKVGYGNETYSKEQIIEACKKAELHELIMTWEKGYDTILGERGFMLSGGQKQRLVIARVFLKDPEILILDEATSALDNIVEKEIQAKLEELMIGRTSITIAHRLSTIKNVDQIIVLGANGRGIVQTGTFEELKNQEGHFRKLYEAGNAQ